jgi:hypothetical protein
VLSLLATNRKTYDYILQNFPDSLIAKSIRHVGSAEAHQIVVLKFLGSNQTAF